MSLSSKQVRALRAETHRLKLKPVVMIGQNGLSENVQTELEQALEHHELIKIRIPALENVEKKELINKISTELNANIIQTIGHVLVLFRKKPKSAKFTKLLSKSAQD
jgi:RNA-binding protein